jgi:ATP-dependent protease ClpP protease subunit
MKNVLAAWSLALMAQIAAAAPPQQYFSLERILPGIRPGIDAGNAILSVPEQAAVILIGDIRPHMVRSLVRIGKAGPMPKTLFVDSYGGDVPSAIAIADFVRENKLRVVVAGRCMSACANYIFAGAWHKAVMPGALVGIHSNQLTYVLNRGPATVSQSDASFAALLSSNPAIRAKVDAIRQQERQFYARIGISTDYHQAYAAYESARAHSKAPVSASCPHLSMWVLTRSQAEHIGVHGIDQYWEPASRAETDAAAARLGLKPDEIFFGSADDLAALCHPHTSLLARLRALF